HSNTGEPIAWLLRQFFDDKSAHMRRAALLVERVDPVISDQRIRHRYNLPAIRGIGQHLLVAGHRGVEANLPNARADCAEGFALEISSVFESYKCAHVTAQYRGCDRIFNFVSAIRAHRIVLSC